MRRLNAASEELRTQEFSDEAIALAQAWLPEMRIDATPLVAFVVFKDDARGFDPVVFDILYKRDRAEFVETVAHEFHHWYRNRIAPDLLRDRDTLWVLEQTQLEGIADLINVPSWMKRPPDRLSESEKRYLAAYQRSGEILGGMDSLFSKMRDDPAQRRTLGASLLAPVPQSGHPTGYFMAQTIVAELGKTGADRHGEQPVRVLPRLSRGGPTGGRCRGTVSVGQGARPASGARGAVRSGHALSEQGAATTRAPPAPDRNGPCTRPI